MLHRVEPILPQLLEEATWRGAQVRFAKPYVNRIFCIYEELRVCLHEILPCHIDKPMWHSHPWETEFKLLAGQQVVGIGYDLDRLYHGQGYTLTKKSEAGKTSPKILGNLFLKAGDSYRMNAITDWHYVAPRAGRSYSIMVNGPQVEVRARPKGFGVTMSKEDVELYKNSWKKLLLDV